jgi:uncharacterized protein (DUF1697 family)
MPTELHTCIALLRGINVGGHHKLSMADLRDALESAGCQAVRTYIQSGNLSLAHTGSQSDVAHRIKQVLKVTFNIRTDVWVVDRSTWVEIIATNPFPEAAVEPKTLHVYLPLGPLSQDAIDRIQGAASQGERIAWQPPALYLHAPAGIGRSRLVQSMDAMAGTPMTGRNWRTMLKLLAL